MSKKMTTIRLRGTQIGFADWGERSFEDMVIRMRKEAQREFDEAKAVLEAKDTDFDVAIVRGPIVQHFVRTVEPQS